MSNKSTQGTRQRRLNGKRVLITGTAGGQGAAAQRAFCEEGACVVGCDITEGGAERAAEALRLEGYDAWGQTVDLSDSAAARDWVDRSVDTLGGLDVLYNNASAARFASFSEMTRELWDFSIRNELDIVFDVTHPAWKYMIKAGASIINVGSSCGIVADATLHQTAHMVAKAGVIALTRQLAAEGGPYGIRANCISPGLIATPATENRPPALMRYSIDLTYLGRIGTTADIVPAAIYLASDESSYMTGANLVIDGGRSSGSPLAKLNFAAA